VKEGKEEEEIRVAGGCYEVKQPHKINISADPIYTVPEV
jgi:F0F1-type ATP synthase epsilon subunit